MFDIHGGDLLFGVCSGEAEGSEWKGIVHHFSLLSALCGGPIHQRGDKIPN